MQEVRLQRVLGLPAVTFIAVGFMIGGGVFVFTGIALDIVGPALPLLTFATPLAAGWTASGRFACIHGMSPLAA